MKKSTVLGLGSCLLVFLKFWASLSKMEDCKYLLYYIVQVLGSIEFELSEDEDETNMMELL